MATRITKRTVDAQHPGDKDRIMFDLEVRGFGLKVTPAGRKVYILQYRMGGRSAATKRYTIAEHGDFTADQARDEAIRLRGLIKTGIDPQAEKRGRSDTAPAQQTFDETADAYLRHAGRHLRPSSLKEWTRIVDRDVRPRWGKRPTAAITRRDVRDLLEVVAGRGAEVQANRTLARLRTVFNWAVEEEILTASPVANLKPVKREVERDRVLSEAEVRWFWRACNEIDWPFGPLFQLLLLTAQRRDELGTIEWSEIELDKQLWTIPREKVKNDRAHEVRLSTLAAAILSALPRIGKSTPASDQGSQPCEQSRFVFTTNGDRPVSGFSKAKDRVDVLMTDYSGGDPASRAGQLLQISDVKDDGIEITATGHQPFRQIDVQRVIGIRHGAKWGYARITAVISPERVQVRVLVPFAAAEPSDVWLIGPEAWILHDLRRTAATGMARMNVAPHVVDRILNHVSGTIRGVAAIYNRHSYLEERQAALDGWGCHLDAVLNGTPANVVRLRSTLDPNAPAAAALSGDVSRESGVLPR